MFIVRTKTGLYLAKYDKYDDALTCLMFWDLYGITAFVWQNGQMVSE